MIKVILFDCDGPIIRHTKYFSQRLKEEKGIVADTEDQASFFNNEFLLCEKGQADLKVEMGKRLKTWGWTGTVEELMEYWFVGEAEVDTDMAEYIKELRNKGIKTYLSTNNEKYRVDYLWKTAGLKNILDGKFPSCELGHLKPEVKFWAQIYKRLSNISKEEVLVLDDAESAISSAKRFGFNAEFYENFEGFKKVMEEKYLIRP
ncbi:MAG: HAD family hydrolase [Candidatus Doudnabacteria bacterium]|jgi:putative hydrolase of the HAD superfamily